MWKINIVLSSIIQALNNARYLVCPRYPRFCGPLRGRKPREKGRRLDENRKAVEKFVSLCFGVECAHRQESVA